MEKNSKMYSDFVHILREELIPAQGCTEPIALALAAARARELLGCVPDEVRVEASGSVIKNVKSVIVPNTDHLKGIPAAVAAGIIAGHSNKGLEVIADATPDDAVLMKSFIDSTPISVEALTRGPVFDQIITLKAGEHYSKVRIANFHTNIVLEEKDGNVFVNKPVENDSSEGLTDRSELTMENIWDFITTCDISDVRPLLARQAEYNMAIAKEGLSGSYGANIGRVLLNTYGDNDVKTRAKAWAAAGSDARMNGCEMPVIVNSGSGNQGITCSVPVIIYAEELGAGEEQLYRALALSNLTAIHQKDGIGRLSAFCGAVSAGAGAGAGIAYLTDGDYETVIHTVVNTLAIVAGIVCDGAKASCAAKIASSVDAAILALNMYRQGQEFHGGDGLVVKGVENTISNISQLGSEGMRETNDEIIRLMTK